MKEIRKIKIKTFRSINIYPTTRRFVSKLSALVKENHSHHTITGFVILSHVR